MKNFKNLINSNKILLLTVIIILISIILYYILKNNKIIENYDAPNSCKIGPMTQRGTQLCGKNRYGSGLATSQFGDCCFYEDGSYSCPTDTHNGVQGWTWANNRYYPICMGKQVNMTNITNNESMNMPKEGQGNWVAFCNTDAKYMMPCQSAAAVNTTCCHVPIGHKCPGEGRQAAFTDVGYDSKNRKICKGPLAPVVYYSNTNDTCKNPSRTCGKSLSYECCKPSTGDICPNDSITISGEKGNICANLGVFTLRKPSSFITVPLSNTMTIQSNSLDGKSCKTNKSKYQPIMYNYKLDDANKLASGIFTSQDNCKEMCDNIKTCTMYETIENGAKFTCNFYKGCSYNSGKSSGFLYVSDGIKPSSSPTPSPKQCPVGSTYDTSQKKCIPLPSPPQCPSGSTYDTSQKKCICTISGEYLDITTNKCITCPSGNTYDNTQQKCVSTGKTVDITGIVPDDSGGGGGGNIVVKPKNKNNVVPSNYISNDPINNIDNNISPNIINIADSSLNNNIMNNNMLDKLNKDFYKFIYDLINSSLNKLNIGTNNLKPKYDVGYVNLDSNVNNYVNPNYTHRIINDNPYIGQQLCINSSTGLYDNCPQSYYNKPSMNQ